MAMTRKFRRVYGVGELRNLKATKQVAEKRKKTGGDQIEHIQCLFHYPLRALFQSASTRKNVLLGGGEMQQCAFYAQLSKRCPRALSLRLL